MRSIPRIALPTLAACLFASAAHAASGELWEFTMIMDMPGAQMPMGKQTFCRKPENAMAPAATPECKITDLKTSGNTTRYRVVCTGAQPMEGVGEGTHTADGYTGTMHMNSAGHEMTMKQAGRKIGTCDNPGN